jgi:peptide/nickel transport system substrate-binding protein
MPRQPVVALALALSLSAAAASAETLRIGMQADPATLDPAQSTSFVDRVALAAVCDKLIDLDASLKSCRSSRPSGRGARTALR